MSEAETTKFASGAKPASASKKSKKSSKTKGDAGVSFEGAVLVISKHQPDGFAVKQMPDDPGWIALQHDLDTMPRMALRAKHAGEANTHRNMLQRIKTCGAVVHPSFRNFTGCHFLR